jgi:hypothetical protein
MMILNEEKYARDLLTGQRDDVKSIKQKIDLITRYNCHVLHKNDDDNYSSTVKWLEKHHDIFSEQSYSNIISDYIKKASKKPFYHIDSIKITKSEMDIILSQNNLRYEKILFVLLCMAKLQKVSYGFDNGLISYNLTELFKMSRVSVPVNEREEILHQFYSDKLIGLPFKNDTKCLFVKFVDESEDDVVLELNEQDCGELAYAYLKYTEKAKIARCSKCGKLIKQSKKFGDLCKGCQEVSTNMRTGWCIDCGKEFQVDSRNMSKLRCDECQKLYRNDYMKELMRNKRKSL